LRKQFFLDDSRHVRFIELKRIDTLSRDEFGMMLMEQAPCGFG
jgi:hypothetical protein